MIKRLIKAVIRLRTRYFVQSTTYRNHIADPNIPWDVSNNLELHALQDAYQRLERIIIFCVSVTLAIKAIFAKDAADVEEDQDNAA